MATENINIKVNLDAKDSIKSLGDLKKFTSDVRKELAGTEIGTKRFFELNDALDESNEKLRTFRRGFDNLKQFEAFGGALAGGFALATSALAAFGSESEDTQKTLLKVQSALGIVQGFTALKNALDAAKAAQLGFNAATLANPYVIASVAVIGLTTALIGLNESLGVSEEEFNASTEAADLNAESIKNVTEQYEKSKKTLADFFDFYNGDIEGTIVSLRNYNKVLKENLILLEKQEQVNKNLFESFKLDINVSNTRDAILSISDALVEIGDIKTAREIKELNNELEKLEANNSSVGEILKQRITIEDVIISKLTERKKLISNSVKDEVEAEQIYRNLLSQQEGLLKNLLEKERTLSNSTFLGVSKEELERRKQDVELSRTVISQQEILINRAKKDLNEFQNLNNQIAEAEQRRTLLFQRQKLIIEQIIPLYRQLQESATNPDVNKFIEESNKLLEERNRLNELELIQFAQKFVSEKAIFELRKRLNQESLQQELFNNKQSQFLAAVELNRLKTLERSEEVEKKIQDISNLLKNLEKEEVKIKFEIDKNSLIKFQGDVRNIQELLQTIGNLTAQASNSITQAIQLASDNRVAIYEAEKNKAVSIFDEQLQQQLITQEEYNTRVAELDAEFQAKRKREKEKAFIAQKSADIISATIATALAVTRALTEGALAGPILAGIVGALGAAQIGIIAAQPVPEFARGGIYQGDGFVRGAGNGTSDSINARLSNGESVINANSTAMFAPLLSAMNQAGGGVNFTGQPKLISAPQGIKENKVNQQDIFNVDVRISESEITNTQARISKIKRQSTF